MRKMPSVRLPGLACSRRHIYAVLCGTAILAGCARHPPPLPAGEAAVAASQSEPPTPGVKPLTLEQEENVADVK